MKNVKLSIIIPCFNSFNMMSRSLDYFQHSDDSFEVVVVDDCSTDGSYESLLQYAERANFTMTVVKNIQNSGLGISRNRGIQEATGQYIVFLDSDDFFTKDFFEKIMPLLDGVNDCIIYDFKYLYDNGKETIYSSFFRNIKEGIVDPKIATAFVRGSTCGKIYRKNLVDVKEIYFLDQRRYEDMPFTKCMVSCCNRIMYIKAPLYVYVHHNASLTHNDSLLTIENAKKAYEYVSNILGSDMAEEKETIFAVEYLVSSASIAIKQKKRKEWIQFVISQESICKGYKSSRYLKEYAKHKQLEIKLIERKAYYLLKIYLILKKNAK